MRYFRSFLLALCCTAAPALPAWSALPVPAPEPATAGAVTGSVVDPSHAVIPNATVTITDAGGASRTATTDTIGNFSFGGVAPGAYTLTVSKDGFSAFQRASMQVSAGQTTTVTVQMGLSSAGQSVTVFGNVVNGANLQPSQQQVFESGQSLRVLDKKQMAVAGPVAGAGQILALTPGANVTGYGNSGATKYTVMLNGINQGWGGYGGFSTAGSLGITFDGIPISDPATSLWQSDTLPIIQLIQNTSVTYGPGDPIGRYYNNIGGGIEFTPLQPTARRQGFLSATYGSYNQKALAFGVSSGLVHGWSTVLGGGGDQGNDFRSGIGDDFKNPSKDWAIYSKTVKSFGENSFELGGYYAHSGGYRSQVIPLVDNPYITVDGQPGSAIYSQPSSGYFSTLPQASYNKYDTNDMALVYGRGSVHLDPHTVLQNTSWYMRIDRTHYRTTDVYSEGPQVNEWNDPHTDTIGDQLSFRADLPMNTVSGAGYYIHALYNSRNNFFDPAIAGAKIVANIGGKVRSSYFGQDDFAVALQDDFHPLARVHITPGIRYVGFAANFADHAQQDFQLAPGAQFDTQCRYNGQGEKFPNGVNTQGACPANQQNRSGVEPSVNGTVRVLPWLEAYGGFSEALRAPQVGGGGGVFQSVDPASYHLERGKYGQVGFKMHTEGSEGLTRNLLFGLAYFRNNFENQEIDTTNAAGDTIDANGSSLFDGVNVYLDDDPLPALHAFVNASFERSNFTNYVVGGTVENNQIVCPSGVGQGGCVSYNNIPVSYVPDATLNLGAYYDWTAPHGLHVQPMLAVQYMGTQHLFDNQTAAPSTQTMPSYTTVNFSVTVPVRRFDVSFNALNLANSRYNAYEYISSGSYFGTAGSSAPPQYQAGYVLAYPGAPFTAYGTVQYHF